MTVAFKDCVIGEAVFFRKSKEPQGATPVPGFRLGQIVARNRHASTVQVTVRVKMYGVLRYVKWTLKAEEIDRFAT